MRRLALLLTVATYATLALPTAAQARSCGRAHIKVFHGHVTANRHTSCPLARRAIRYFVLTQRTHKWVRSPVTHKLYRFRLYSELGGLGSGYYVEARARGANGTTLAAGFRVRR
jgi:hypothetical protein